MLQYGKVVDVNSVAFNNCKIKVFTLKEVKDIYFVIVNKDWQDRIKLAKGCNVEIEGNFYAKNTFLVDNINIL